MGLSRKLEEQKDGEKPVDGSDQNVELYGTGTSRDVEAVRQRKGGRTRPFWPRREAASATSAGDPAEIGINVVALWRCTCQPRL